MPFANAGRGERFCAARGASKGLKMIDLHYRPSPGGDRIALLPDGAGRGIRMPAIFDHGAGSRQRGPAPGWPAFLQPQRKTT